MRRAASRATGAALLFQLFPPAPVPAAPRRESPVKEKDRSLLVSYALLGAGALGAIGLFAARSRIWEFIDPFPRLLFFLLWLLAPFALLAFNTFAIDRWILGGRGGRAFLSGTLLFLGSGALIYSRALAVPEEEVMEISLVFLMGPLPHFAAAILVTAGYLVHGARLILGGRKRSGGDDTR